MKRIHIHVSGHKVLKIVDPDKKKEYAELIPVMHDIMANNGYTYDTDAMQQLVRVMRTTFKTNDHIAIEIVKDNILNDNGEIEETI